jgi:RNA binding exosome subunit
MSDEQKNTEVSLGDKVVGAVELPKFNVDEFLGQEVVIEKVTEHKGIYGYYIKIMSSEVTKFNGKVINASRMFNLTTLEDGTIGWGTESKLAVFLKKCGVEKYSDLVGVSIKVNKTLANKEGQEFLTF